MDKKILNKNDNTLQKQQVIIEVILTLTVSLIETLNGQWPEPSQKHNGAPCGSQCETWLKGDSS